MLATAALIGVVLPVLALGSWFGVMDDIEMLFGNGGRSSIVEHYDEDGNLISVTLWN